jgi:high-affinity iron transporter
VLPTLVIFFRESLEASLIVGILLAYLVRLGRRREARAVWFGVAAAVAADFAVALASFRVIHDYDGSRVQAALEGSTYLLATAMLTYMSFWMKGQGRGLKGELEARAATALGRGSLVAVVVLAAVTVGREGLETAFFTLAIALHATSGAVALGAALGLLAGLAVTWAVHRLGRRVPLGAFFDVLGVLLLLFAAGLLADAVEAFQALGWLPLLRGALWHTGRWLSEDSPLGDILHSFFGYADAPSPLQVGCYAAVLATTVASYLRLGRPGAGRRRAPARA